MSILVQKFGGTSVADSQKILAAARRAIRAFKEGRQVVVVVSAMGEQTDRLIELAKEISEYPPAREMDMLLSTGEQVTVALMAMAIHALGHEAISLTGAQIGIVTDSTYTKARIRSVSTARICQALDAGNIVIAAGFQGIDEAGNITTLGRGGSDTTAVALAAVLGADVCEIYTDVDGVYTTDPRIVPDARPLRRISYDEMLELATAGAGVMHNRSIEFAKKFQVPIHVRSSFSDAPGTLISHWPESAEAPVCGAAMVKDEARLAVLGLPDDPMSASRVLARVAAKNISLDMIVRNETSEGRCDLSFTIFRDDLREALRAVNQAIQEWGAEGCTYDENVSKVSVVGLGMATRPGVALTMFRALAEKGISSQMISTSEIKISAVVPKKLAQEALRTVHNAFELHVAPTGDGQAQPATRPPLTNSNVDILLKRMERMEDLLIESIDLDRSQAQITFQGLPDMPGLTVKVFDELAATEVVVDMIVQGVGREKRLGISVTVPRDALPRAMAAAKKLTEGLACSPPRCRPEVAKISLSGVGMKSHAGVAARMFQALAEADIKAELVSTSEAQLAVVVDDRKGVEALEVLKREFAEAMC